MGAVVAGTQHDQQHVHRHGCRITAHSAAHTSGRLQFHSPVCAAHLGAAVEGERRVVEVVGVGVHLAMQVNRGYKRASTLLETTSASSVWMQLLLP